MNRFGFEGNVEGLTKSLNSHLPESDLNERQATFILEYLAAHGGDEDTVERRKSESSRSGLDWRVDQLFIDVPNTLLIGAAAAMDAIWTRGAAMALLTASGRDLRAWASLEPSHGAFCNFVTIEEKQEVEAISADEIAGRTKNKPCLHPKIGCVFDFEGGCRITAETISKNLADLAERRAVELNAAGEAIRVR